MALRQRQDPCRRVITGSVGIKIDVVFMQRPEETARVGRPTEQLHPFISAVRWVGRQVVGQLDVIPIALPDVLNDRHMIDTQVL